MPKLYTVDDDYNDSRLDKWFKSKIINVPHSLLEKILRQNKVKINWIIKITINNKPNVETLHLINIFGFCPVTIM